MTQATATVPAGGAGANTSKRLCWLALGAILVVAALLRLHGISAASLWFDEAGSWHRASQDFATMIALTADDNNTPLHNSILYLFIRAFGDSETVLRLPSALMGIATVAAIFWTGRLLDGWATGILAAALLCLSGFHIHYSQEARPYALMALTATLFAGTLIRALQTDRRVWHGACAVATLFLLYSHAYGQLIWFSLSLAAFASAMARRDPEPKVLVRWAAGQAIAVLAFLPWAGILAWRYKHMVTDGFVIPRPDGAYMLDIVQNLASGWPMALALAAGTALAFVPASRRLAGNSGDRHPAQNHAALERWLLVAWLLGPLLLALAASLISEPILKPRYVIGSLPAWLILASMGFCRLSRMWGNWVTALAIAGAAANLYFYQPLRHEDARAMVKAYAEQAAPGDCVFLNQTDLRFEIDYYHRDRAPCFISTDMTPDITPWSIAAPRAWMFFGYGDGEAKRKMLENLPAHGWPVKTVMSGYGLTLMLAEHAK